MAMGRGGGAGGGLGEAALVRRGAAGSLDRLSAPAPRRSGASIHPSFQESSVSGRGPSVRSVPTGTYRIDRTAPTHRRDDDTLPLRPGFSQYCRRSVSEAMFRIPRLGYNVFCRKKLQYRDEMASSDDEYATKKDLEGDELGSRCRCAARGTAGSSGSWCRCAPPRQTTSPLLHTSQCPVRLRTRPAYQGHPRYTSAKHSIVSTALTEGGLPTPQC